MSKFSPTISTGRSMGTTTLTFGCRIRKSLMLVMANCLVATPPVHRIVPLGSLNRSRTASSASVPVEVLALVGHSELARRSVQQL